MTVQGADRVPQGLLPLGPCLVVGPRDAFYLSSALDLLVRLLDQRDGGARLPEHVVRAHTQLRALGAAYEHREAIRTDADVSASARGEADRAGSAHDLVDTADAAQILGTTAHNVRDLRRRDRLPGQFRGGRWWFERATVLEVRDARTA